MPHELLMSWFTELARPEIRALRAYEHAVWEPGLVRLHANELPWRGRNDLSGFASAEKRIVGVHLVILQKIVPIRVDGTGPSEYTSQTRGNGARLTGIIDAVLEGPATALPGACRQG